jgi:hypothetical protein
MRRVVIAFGVAGLLFACAAIFGWREYVAHPQGTLLYTPRGPCPPLAHSFSIGLAVALLLSAAVGLCAALLGFLASFIPRWAPARSLRGVSFNAILVLPFLGAMWFSHPLFESLFPQQPVPGCGHAAP